MTEKKKERVELQFNMEKEADLLRFIDENGSTRAGFIKTIIRQYMNTMQSLGQQNLVQQSKEETTPTKNINKKKVPKLGSSFSSKDFE